MSGSVSGLVKAEPNLTPILDMVFQLITFFVLIFNCKNAEMASGVDLPVVGSARVPKPSDDKIIVFNCKFEDAKGEQAGANKAGRPPQIWVMGSLIPEDKLADLVAAEEKSSLQAAGLTEDDIHTGGKELKDIIAIRADADIPFGVVNKVIYECQVGGYRQFIFKTKIQKEASAP